jgi:hypothetical protein
MLISGLFGIIIVETYSAIMQLKFQHTNNTVGKAFAILGIYLFSVVYCKLCSSMTKMRCLECETDLKFSDGMINSTTWTYGAEILPIALRSKVMGLGAMGHFIVNVASMSPLVSSQAQPSFSSLHLFTTLIFQSKHS